jgi:hypothetical protein
MEDVKQAETRVPSFIRRAKNVPDMLCELKPSNPISHGTLITKDGGLSRSVSRGRTTICIAQKKTATRITEVRIRSK